MEEQRSVRVHVYNTTSYAYDETQTSDEIRDGDVVIAEAESVVGILDGAWPFAVTVEHGEFHGPPKRSAHLLYGGKFIESLTVALTEAYGRGFVVSPLNAPRTDALIDEDLRPPDEFCYSCEDGSGMYPVYNHSTDAVVGWRQCPVTRNHPPRPPGPKPEPTPCLPGCDGTGFTRSDCCPPF